MERNWDMKAMHKLLMTSRAYRMESSAWAPDAPQAKADPDNTYLWRMNSRRMSAENVRDSLLSLAGKLDPTMGGPEIDETQGQDVYRRSIYFRHTPDLQMEMLRVFDAASPIECFQRSESIVPQQALALSNSKLSQAMSEEVAKNLAATGPRFVTAAFERVLSRQPTAAEKKSSEEFLVEQETHYRSESQPPADPAARARQSLVHVLLTTTILSPFDRQGPLHEACTHLLRSAFRRVFLADTCMGLTGLALGTLLPAKAGAADDNWSLPTGKPHFLRGEARDLAVHAWRSEPRRIV